MAESWIMKVDLIVSAHRIYTMDDSFPLAQSVAVRQGRIIAAGSKEEIQNAFSTRKRIDFGQAVVYPGFIDPHCHFLGYGYVLQRAQLFGVPSWEEAVDRMVQYAKREALPLGAWIQGRGWDQNEWPCAAFPDSSLLDDAFPANPAIAIRVDGHAALINTKAREIAGIRGDTRIEGGEIRLSSGRPTGLILDKAVDRIRAIIPRPEAETSRMALLKAQENCFAVGLTSVSNAGTEAWELRLMEDLQAEGSLSIGLYAMLMSSEENLGRARHTGPYASEKLTVCSFKMFADGALGSRGAFLLEDYADDPGNRGLVTLDPAELDRVASIAYKSGFQMNVHAIGDGALSLVLDAYGRYLKPGEDRRWRIEHAQVVQPADLERIRSLGVVPSIQTTHATSDMGWTESRLGQNRMSRSHAYRDLLHAAGWLANGSDFPIEKIDPLRGFRSAVFRKNDAREPLSGYRMNQALRREEALKAMTIWAAKANFEEGIRGSIEPGKLADFTVLDVDLIQDSEERIWAARVLGVFVEGSLRAG
ncbi:MAG: putative TIM-barrel fold metal-dependent hydrolase [Spirochaetes bacterium]|nr:MAG: putative TIM-barrel fold metal-dependent hydrolase [Spirochaetota bacterium]